MRLPVDDEIYNVNAVIITQNSGLSLNYSLPDGNNNQHIFVLSGNLQTVGDDIDNPLESSKSRMIVGNFTYNYALADSKWRFSARLNYNQNELSQMLIDRIGGGLGVSKSLLENKMNFGLDLNYFFNSNEVGANSTNLNGQLRWSYSLTRSLNASLNWNLLRTNSDDIDPFTESMGTLGFQYAFNIKPIGRKDRAAQEAPATPDNQ